jgi:hypothetical protein
MQGEQNDQTNTDVQRLFGDTEARKRKTEARPPNVRSRRLKYGLALGVIAGLIYSQAATFLSGIRNENLLSGLVMGLIFGALLGLVNALPNSGIQGISLSALVFGSGFVFWWFFGDCLMQGVLIYPTLLGVLLMLGIGLGYFLAALIPAAVLRWAIDEQREQFDSEWWQPPRLRTVAAVGAVCALMGWVLPFVLGMVGVMGFCTYNLIP